VKEGRRKKVGGIVTKLKAWLSVLQVFYTVLQVPQSVLQNAPCHYRWELLWSKSTEK